MNCIFCKHKFKHTITDNQYLQEYYCPNCESTWKVINGKVQVTNTPNPCKEIIL